MASEYSVKKANHREQMEILDRQHKRKVQTTKNDHRQAMTELRNRQGTEKLDQQQNQKNQLEHLKQQNDTFVQRERLNHKARLDKQNLQAQKDYQKAANQKARSNARLKNEGQVEKENYVAVREKYRNKAIEKKNKGERTLESMERESQFTLKQKQAQHLERERSLKEAHRGEMARVEKHGRRTVAERKDKYIDKEIKQKKAHNHNLKKNEMHFTNLKERQHTHYHEKIEKDEKFFQEQLKNQRNEYKNRYQDNERFNKASYENQDNRLAEEMFKLKKDFVSTAKFYEDRKQDPFYSLVDFGAEFQEGEAFYEIKANIPEHEMKNVRVHVQPNKVSLHATRQHEQEFKADNEKIGSNIAQTIRQEFELAKPAEHEQAIKNFKDGVLTITIPKKGHYRFGMG